MAKVVNTGFDTEFSGPLGKFRDFLRSKGIETNIISGVRDDEDQRQLVANRNATLAGRPLPYPDRGKVYVAAPVGSSAHEYGEAADVQPVNPANAAAMHKYAKQFGLEMPNWGGHDPYHVQLSNWQQAASTQAAPTPWDQTNPANVPSRMAMNMEAGGPPGTTINGSAPIAGALSRPSTPTPGTPVNDFYHVSMMHESGGKNVANTDAGPSFGRAQGYYQFMPSTYAGVRKARPDLNLPENVMDANQDQQTEAYREFTKGNVAALQAAGIPINDKNVFMASFLGPGGATKFLGQMAKDSSANAADLFPTEAKSNTSVFYANGQPRTLQQVYDLQTKMHGSGNTTGFGPDAAPSDATPTAASTPTGQQTADNQSLFGRFTQGPIDPATGKPTPGAVTPMAQIADAILNNTKNTQAKVDAAGPERTALSDMPAPVARNVSPMGGAMLPNVAQTYGQTLNSFARPLSYDASPPQAPQMAPAGFRGSFGPQAQGVSLNSLPPLPMAYPGQIRPLTLDEYGYQGAGYAS